MMNPSSSCIVGAAGLLIILLVTLLGFIIVSSPTTLFVTAQTFGIENSAIANSGERGFTGITVDTVNSNIFVSSVVSPANIVKYTTSPTLARTAGVTLASGEGNCGSIASQGSFIYVVCAPGAGVGKILRRNAADLTAAGSIDRSGANERSLKVVLADATNSFIYAVSANADSAIVRIHMSNFTYFDTLVLTGIQNVSAALITSTDSYILGAASNVGAPIGLFRIEPTVFTRFDTLELTLNAGERGVNYGIAEDSTFVYVATTQAIPVIIVKVRMSDLTRISSVTLATNENICRGLSADGPSGSLYVSLALNPARIVRVSTATMTRVEGVDAATGVNEAWQSRLFSNKLYVATRGVNSAGPDNVVQLGIVTTTTTTTTGPPTNATSTTTTTETSTTSTTTITTSTTTTTTTPAPPTTSSTTTLPPPPPTGWGQGDDSLAVGGTSAVAIVAGLGVGAGVILLLVLLWIFSGKVTAAAAASAAASANNNNTTEARGQQDNNNSGNTNHQEEGVHEEGEEMTDQTGMDNNTIDEDEVFNDQDSPMNNNNNNNDYNNNEGEYGDGDYNENVMNNFQGEGGAGGDAVDMPPA